MVSQSRNKIKKFSLLDLLGNCEIKRQPVENQGCEKKSSSGKEMEMGVPVTA